MDIPLFIANVMPMDLLVKELSKAAEQFKADPTNDNKKRNLGVLCHLFLSKIVCEKKGYQQVSETIDNVMKAYDLITTKPN